MFSQTQLDKINEVINEWKNQRGALIPVLQKAQDIIGYLPIEIQQIIADGLGISLAEVYAVATFYAQFNLNKIGKHKISVCMGTACYVKGSQAILDELAKQLGVEPGGTTEDGLFTLTPTRCLGACGLAPVMVIDDDVYGRLVPSMIKDILAKYN
ncbi:MAG: NADH-quinone oxidoreductase subunit NuoE [Christensenellaceae bacterium]|nr:NADH-quinone oxidoreductase subunit NuoE [Christensenellaceae bacterium]